MRRGLRLGRTRARGAERGGNRLRRGRYRIRARHYQAPNLTFEQASCGDLPYAEGSFDLIVAFEVIEHLPDWRQFLQEARRTLAPNGQFIVSTPNKLYYGNRAARRERIPSTYTSSSSPNSATSCAMSSPTFRSFSRTTWRA